MKPPGIGAADKLEFDNNREDALDIISCSTCGASWAGNVTGKAGWVLCFTCLSSSSSGSVEPCGIICRDARESSSLEVLQVSASVSTVLALVLYRSHPEHVALSGTGLSKLRLRA